MTQPARSRALGHKRPTLLAPDIQERVLTGELGLSARELYRISGMPSWAAQRAEIH